MSARRVALVAALAALAVPAVGTSAEVSFSGSIQSDVRLRLRTIDVGSFYNQLSLSDGVSLNQNLLRAKVVAREGNFAGVADLEFVWLGYTSTLDSVTDLSHPDKVNPYFLRVKGLYVEAKDLFKGLDLRVGQQLVMWGVGDQFNPTNVINANDLYDPLLFGQQVPNLMARADWSVKRNWVLSGVVVPVFKPAVLPTWGRIAMAFPDRIPLVDDALRQRIQAEQAAVARLADADPQLFSVRYPTVVTNAMPVVPKASFENVQAAVRLAGVIKEQDVALSYYYGRTDMPHPYLNLTRQVPGRRCDPVNPTTCIDGTLQTETYLSYPRMQMIGLNVAGEMNPLGWLSKKIEPLGYRLEVGLFLPRAASLTLLQESLDFGDFYRQAAGEYDYGSQYVGRHPNVIDSTPFLKWTAGLDYTFNEHVYANVQWVHGFVDEFGAGDFMHRGWTVAQGSVTSDPADTLVCALSQDGSRCAREILRPRLGDYLVLGVDLKFLEERVLARLFTIWALNGIVDDHWDADLGRRVQTKKSMFTADGFSAVVFPELDYNFRNGLEMGLGALLMLGKTHSKFGDPATGGHLLWARAKYSW
jgi:hypothetical protein